MKALGPVPLTDPPLCDLRRPAPQRRLGQLAQHVELAVVERAERRNVGLVDDRRPLLFHLRDRLFGNLSGGVVSEQAISHDADARAAEPSGIEKPYVIVR
jgi:hypothetical protein